MSLSLAHDLIELFWHSPALTDALSACRTERTAAFQNLELDDCTLCNCFFRNTRLVNCDLTSMTIDGIIVSDMIKVYKENQSRQKRTFQLCMNARYELFIGLIILIVTPSRFRAPDRENI